MAILKIKRLLEDLENNTTQILVNPVAKATSAGYGGTAYLATSAGQAGTSYLSTSAGQAGTAAYASTASRAGTSFVAHYASSGTANIAGTSAVWSTGGL